MCVFGGREMYETCALYGYLLCANSEETANSSLLTTTDEQTLLMCQDTHPWRYKTKPGITWCHENGLDNWCFLGFYGVSSDTGRNVLVGYLRVLGTAVSQWLMCCATNRKIAGSIPDGVIGIFHWHDPSDRTMALGSTQSLTEMSTRRISWGLMWPVRKADNLATSLCRCHEIWEP